MTFQYKRGSCENSTDAGEAETPLQMVYMVPVHVCGMEAGTLRGKTHSGTHGGLSIFCATLDTPLDLMTPTANRLIRQREIVLPLPRFGLTPGHSCRRSFDLVLVLVIVPVIDVLP